MLFKNILLIQREIKYCNSYYPSFFRLFVDGDFITLFRLFRSLVLILLPQ